MKLTNLTARESTMSNVYIEPRPKGRPKGDPIDDYVVEDHADHLLATFKTQREAIEWAKKNGHTATDLMLSVPQMFRLEPLNQLV